ncbi:MAG: hypothetical protein ACM3ST_07930 [Bdellovibrio bacteriovorus]
MTSRPRGQNTWAILAFEAPAFFAETGLHPALSLTLRTSPRLST